MMGKLFVVGTPIGNMQDITVRAVKTLNSVDYVLCEDTRQSSKLLDLIFNLKFEILNQFFNDPSCAKASAGKQYAMKQTKPKLVRFDGQVERVMTHKVIADLKAGKQIALVSDAGMPGISDPGMYLVGRCREKGLVVEVIPGPSALTTAVAAAGFEAKELMFLGFLPKKKGERTKKIRALKRISGTTLVVFYEAPLRLKETLSEIRTELNDPIVTACGELTKMHEKVIRGKASDVVEKLQEPVKGEWVVIIKLGVKK